MTALWWDLSGTAARPTIDRWWSLVINAKVERVHSIKFFGLYIKANLIWALIILSQCCIVWYSSCTAENRKDLFQVVKTVCGGCTSGPGLCVCRPPTEEGQEHEHRRNPPGSFPVCSLTIRIVILHFKNKDYWAVEQFLPQGCNLHHPPSHSPILCLHLHTQTYIRDNHKGTKMFNTACQV